MPNYEELYYIARNNYNNAIDERNRIINSTYELQSQKNSISYSLKERNSELSSIQYKKSLVQDVLTKAKNILNDEFPSMKRDLINTSEEYKKMIFSDQGVADISEIYDSDINLTKTNLENIISDFERSYIDLDNQEAAKKNEINCLNNDLQSVCYQLRNVGNEEEMQRHINAYFTEMKEYETRWQNGE